MIFYAVVSGEIHQVIEFYRTPAEAEAMVEFGAQGRTGLGGRALGRAGRARTGGRN